MALSATIKAALSAQQTVTGDLGSGTFRLNPEVVQQFTDGAGAAQIDRMFSDTRTIAASASENLDLAGGGLLDAFGAALTFARIKAVLVKAAAGNTNDVVFSRPAANGVPLFNAASDAINIKPGGCFLWMAPDAAGIPVTAGTGDLLTVANGGAGTPVSYDVVILGAGS